MGRRSSDDVIYELASKVSEMANELKHIREDIEGLKENMGVKCMNCSPNKYLKTIALILVLLTVGVFMGPDRFSAIVDKFSTIIVTKVL